MDDGRRIYLIDTPGLDDEQYSDSIIIKMVSLKLAELYKNSQNLRGIIYLFGISQYRVGGRFVRVRLSPFTSAPLGLRLILGRIETCSNC